MDSTYYHISSTDYKSKGYFFKEYLNGRSEAKITENYSDWD